MVQSLDREWDGLLTLAQFEPGAANTAGVTGLGLGIIGTPAQLGVGEAAPQQAGALNNMKISSIPKSGRVDSVVFLNTRYGKVVREYVCPRNPHSSDQQNNRSNFGAVASRWRTLIQEQRAAWCIARADEFFVTDTGRWVRARGYNFFVSLNRRRADLDLPQFDLPPAEPVFPPNPVVELVITDIAGKFTLKLRVSSPPAQYTLVQAAAPVRTGVRCVQHFHFLELLPPPTDGWSDITEGFVARYGEPKVGKAIWIRTCQHIDGWIDVPKVVHARVPAAAA